MLNFTKTVTCLVIKTAQQVDIELMHLFEKFRQNLLVKFYSLKDFNFLTHQLNPIQYGGGGALWPPTVFP